jgi:hypothetical protein
VTEINPGVNRFLSKKDPATSEKNLGKNTVHTTQKCKTARIAFSPEKIRGVPRGKPKNSPVTQTGTGNSPVQKRFYPKRASIQPNKGPHSR